MSNLFHDSGPAATGQKVLLATTAYENPDASYTFSIQQSREALTAAGIQSGYLLLSGNCHVDDARNRVIQEFLLTDCTDLIFIDADVSWGTGELVKLCGYDRDLVGGVYPYRRPDARAVMPFRMMGGITEPDSDGLLEVEGIPAGFMRIRRHVLERLTKVSHQYWYGGDRRSKTAILFERYFSAGTRWGGDLHFCNKWRAMGGKVYAAYEMKLGHTSKSIIIDSLGSALRRESFTTLEYVAKQIAAGSQDISLLTEARRFTRNHWGAPDGVLALAMLMARRADGPIVEAGSGLSTVIMAAANPGQTVYSLEHDTKWLDQTKSLAVLAGVENIKPILLPIRDGWYNTSGVDLPSQFALGLNDGPPRVVGDRMGFFKHIGHRCETIVVDDCDDRAYADRVEDWAAENHKRVDFVDDRAALLRPKPDTETHGSI